MDQSSGPTALVLGVCQDGGHPHPGCDQSCCQEAWNNPHSAHRVACLGLIDRESGRQVLIDATPDFAHQLKWLGEAAGSRDLTGILLTHAHLGHIAGLVYLGREALDTRQMPIWVMPRLGALLRDNQPYRSLIEDGNIQLMPLRDGQTVAVSKNLQIAPFVVPHRDELSETVGFHIRGPTASLIYVPDCDGWDDWRLPIEHWISQVDVALIDGTFYSANEPKYRHPDDVRHPTISSSVGRFAHLSPKDRSKIHFTHLNHTNPLLDTNSRETELTVGLGFRIAGELQRFEL